MHRPGRLVGMGSNLILDIDSSESPVQGQQQGAAWNGHFDCACYHPLFVYNQHGDLERCALRPGNVHNGHGWRAVLDLVIQRYWWSGMSREYLRVDAAFAMPDLFDYLEANGFGYATWLRADKVLEFCIAYLLKRIPERPSNTIERHYANFSYKAGSRRKPRRVVAKVGWHPGKLFPRVGFVVTTLTVSEERICEFYNLRGTSSLGSMKANRRPGGHCSPAGALLRPTRSGCRFTRWLTTSPTSCAPCFTAHNRRLVVDQNSGSNDQD